MASLWNKVFRAPAPVLPTLPADIRLWRTYILTVRADEYTISSPHTHTPLLTYDIHAECHCAEIYQRGDAALGDGGLYNIVRKDLENTPAPYSPHRCGIYGYYNPRHAALRTTPFYHAPDVRKIILESMGVSILVSGTVQPGWYVAAERGMRAENFRLDRLYLSRELFIFPGVQKLWTEHQEVVVQYTREDWFGGQDHPDLLSELAKASLDDRPSVITERHRRWVEQGKPWAMHPKTGRR